jgi:hypothetical protein
MDRRGGMVRMGIKNMNKTERTRTMRTIDTSYLEKRNSRTLYNAEVSKILTKLDSPATLPSPKLSKRFSQASRLPGLGGDFILERATTNPFDRTK